MCAPCFSFLPQPKACPECRGPYDNPVRHNLVVEGIISRTESAVSCGNWSCKEMIRGVRMTEHMAECRHRTVPCPHSFCTSKISFNSVGEHIKVHKAVRMSTNQTVYFPMSKYKEWANHNWALVVYEEQGQRFYLQCLSRNKVFMAWVKVEGGREEAARWRATITVPSPKKNIICESELFPIDSTTEDLIDSGDCLVMVEKELVKFNAANEIPLEISLTKV